MEMLEREEDNGMITPVIGVIHMHVKFGSEPYEYRSPKCGDSNFRSHI